VGRVSDSSSGHGVGLATVSVEGVGLRATSADDGSYRIANVPVGPHTAKAARIGYAAVSKPVTVLADQDVAVDFALTPQATELEQVVAIGYGDRKSTRLNSSHEWISY